MRSSFIVQPAEEPAPRRLLTEEDARALLYGELGRECAEPDCRDTLGELGDLSEAACLVEVLPERLRRRLTGNGPVFLNVEASEQAGPHSKAAGVGALPPRRTWLRTSDQLASTTGGTSAWASCALAAPDTMRTTVPASISALTRRGLAARACRP